MSVYLIDYENTKQLSGVSLLSEDDMVVVFYTKNSNSITFDTLNEISGTSARIKYVNVGSGSKNALDFQLSSFLGYLIKENEQKSIQYYIVSKDKGFLVLQSFWSEKYFDVKVIEDFSGKEVKSDDEQPTTGAKNKKPVPSQRPKKQPQPTTDDNSKDIRKAITESSLNLTKDNVRFIVETVNKYKTKQSINKELMGYFKDSEKVGEVTKAIKPFLKCKN